MTVRLLLCRHGTHDEVGRVLSGRSEIGLNAAGHAEAAALARCLSGQTISTIISSPRRRARETAAPIAELLGTPVTIDADLDEIDFGSFAGRTFAELDRASAWQRWNAERDTFRCPGGETMGEVVERAERCVSGVAAIGATVFVTHCDVIRGLVARRLGLPFGRLFDLPCDPGSITELALEDGRLRLVTLNERPG